MSLKTRLILYDKTKKSLNNIINKNKCIEYDNNKQKLILINNIILEKRIGSSSVNGLIMLSSVNNNKVIIKIASINKDNLDEIKLSKKITTDIILKHNIPHFVINYTYFICEAKNLSNICPKNNKNYKDLCYYFGNKKYYMCINELADGDLFSLIRKKNTKLFRLSIIKNFIAQMFISVYSLHYYLNYSHNDTHLGNFLYVKIPHSNNDYYHYIINGKDYYLKNKGYIIILTDFGRSTKKINIANEPITYRSDYELPLTLKNNYINYNLFKFRNFFKNIINLSFGKIYQDEKSFINEQLETLMKLKLNKNDIIINKDTPYVIG